MNKVELNDNYINKIITGDSELFSLEYQKELDDNKWEITIKSNTGEYFSGIVLQKGSDYIIDGDTEFDRVYPSIDKKTGKIVDIIKSETHPPGENRSLL